MHCQMCARNDEYYSEGSLGWLDADMLIRTATGNRKSLDDFARSFLRGREGDWGEVTYEFDDVAQALNAIYPYDWASFLDQRMRAPGQPAPVQGIERADAFRPAQIGRAHAGTPATSALTVCRLLLDNK